MLAHLEIIPHLHGSDVSAVLLLATAIFVAGVIAGLARGLK